MEISYDFLKLQLPKYNLFKEQNPETGRFDVAFEFEGKLIYAHKTMLIFVSETFDAMLSVRWTPNKDEPIKIQDYSYDNFYQFLTFLYSAKCQLTDSNIYSMVDIAEFYGVEIFKNYCDKYLSCMKITVQNVFQFIDLAEKFTLNQIRKKIIEFTASNFLSVINSNGFLNIEKCDALSMVESNKNQVEPEDLFRAVYQYSEKRTSDAQIVDPNLDFNESIKAEISDFLPHILFCAMDLNFLHEFIVSRDFIFSSFNEFSEILCDRDRFFEGKIKITNKYGRTLHGNVIPDKTVLRNIESIKQLNSYLGISSFYWKTKFQIPSNPSQLKKREGVQWYLTYDYSGDIGVKHCSVLDYNSYLLAELTPGSNRFGVTNNCKIEIE